jgi:hypothetical protein
VLSIYRSNCPYTTAYSAYGQPADSECTQFKRDIGAWFAAHPEVATVFVSANAGAPTVTPPGADRFANKAAGYRAAWEGLPATVKRLYVLRDVFHQRATTPDCVERHPAKCAIPRRTALPPDPQVTAAAAVPRATVLDLTPLMCDAKRCFPVVGGVLVHKDRGHMTRTFAATLAPYLERALSRT